MTDALATVATWLGAIALALVVLLLIVAMLAFLARRVRPVVRVDPWVNHSGVPALDIGGGLASLLLGELQRIQRVLNDAVNDPEMTAGTVADLTPVTDADVGDAPDLLPSVELEGQLGAVMAAARAATLSSPPSFRSPRWSAPSSSTARPSCSICARHHPRAVGGGAFPPAAGS